MILQRLYADADAILKQTRGSDAPAIPSGFIPARVHWYVEIDANDPTAPPQFIPMDLDAKGRGGVERLLPNVKRSSGVKPLLLSDSAAYALGWDIDGDDKRAPEKFRQFRELVKECAAKTESVQVTAIAAFLAHWSPEDYSVPPGLLGLHRVAFRVKGVRPEPLEEEAVRKFWAGEEPATEAREDTEPYSQCLLSGKFMPTEELMPVAVKGIPGGQPAGTHLVSANAAAFESYGLKRAKTSPISKIAGETFGNALNALLASDTHRQSLAGSVYVFWCRAGKVRLPAFSSDPGAVREFLTAHKLGKTERLGEGVPSSAKFYCFGLVANAARVAVRSSIETTIGELDEAQREWFTRLSMIGPDGAEGDPIPLYTLALAAFRESKDVIPGITDALTQAALTGAKLPETLLQLLLNRCRLDTERRVTYPRAALLKYILTQKEPLEEAIRMSQEVTGEMPPAYHCGRLFAELEDIQRQALPGINATISDKFFGSASSAPASVFGILLSNVQSHLAKLRKEREGAYHGAQKRLEEILSEVGDFPTTLPLKEQARFSLGYYQHRAAKRADIAERTAAKKRAGQMSLEGLEQETK